MSDARYRPPGAVVADQADDEAPRQRPVAVQVAFVLFLIGIAADGVLLVTTLSEVSIGNVGGPRLVGMTFGLLFASWLYVMIFRGRNWARIVTLVFTCIGFVLLYRTIPILVSFGLASIEFTMALVRPVCSAAALFLVFGPGRSWFRRGIN